MRIGLFSDTYPPEINGVATATSTLAEIFKKHGHEVFVITTNPYSNHVIYEDNIIRIPGVRLKMLYDYHLAFLFNRKAALLIRKMKLDVIHIQTEIGIGMFGKILAKRYDIPLVYTYHTMYEDYTYYVTRGHFDRAAKAIVKRFSKTMADSCSEFTTPSQKTKEALRGYGVNRYINVVPNGIDIKKFDPAQFSPADFDDFRKKHHLENKKILLSLGRIAKEKSIDFLIRGYATFLRDTKDQETMLLVVGDGPGKKELEALSLDLSIGDRVLFLGKVPHEDVPFYYSLANLFLSASTSETQGLTYIEAMASKTIVLCRYDDNLREVIDDGESGFFFYDEVGYVNLLKKILGLSEEMSANIIEKAFIKAENYSIDTFYDKMLEVYKRAIRRKW